MKTYQITKNQMTVTAYNDSNVEWVVQGGGHSPARFSKKNGFTMKAAASLYIDIFKSEWEF